MTCASLASSRSSQRHCSSPSTSPAGGFSRLYRVSSRMSFARFPSGPHTYDEYTPRRHRRGLYSGTSKKSRNSFRLASLIGSSSPASSSP